MSLEVNENAKNVNLASKSILILGIVKNIDKTIKADIQIFSSAFASFKQINFFVVESGSSDGSNKTLDLLTKKYKNFQFKSIDYDPNQSRTENMASARNVYLDHFREKYLPSEDLFIVIADFNNLNNELKLKSILSCWGNTDWDVVTANQKGRYYDVWALRHPLWSPNDCWESLEFYRKYIRFPEVALAYSLRSRMLKIPQNSEWLEVDSAFGGIGIYKSSLLESPVKYEGTSFEGKPICEHVPFHKQLREKGARIYINPDFVNTRITDHSRRMTLLSTLIRIMSYPVKIFKLND